MGKGQEEERRQMGQDDLAFLIRSWDAKAVGFWTTFWIARLLSAIQTCTWGFL